MRVLFGWMVAAALADECACLAWDDVWSYTNCTEDCACDCTDDVVHGGGTTTETGTVCSEDGLVGTPPEGSECQLVSTCIETDCCDELNADCPGEEDSAADCGGCATAGPGGAVGAALGVLGAALRRRQKKSRIHGDGPANSACIAASDR